MNKPITVELIFYPYPKYKPKKEGSYLVQLRHYNNSEFQDDCWYEYTIQGETHYGWVYFIDDDIIAWAEMPKGISCD